MDLEEVKRAILGAYLSMEEPHYDFAEKRYGGNPYSDILASLGERFTVEETTDLNDDVCVSLFLHRENGGYGLRLSLVGRYAAMVDRDGRWLDAASAKQDDVQYIVSLMQRHQIELLSADELRLAIPFCPVNSDQTRASLYEILFSCDEALQEA